MNRKIIYSVLLLCLMTYGAVAQVYKGTITVSCGLLQEREGQLYIELDMEVSKEAVNKNQSWIITPIITTGTQVGARSKVMAPVVVQGNNKRQMRDRKQRFDIVDNSNRVKPYQVLSVKNSATRGRVIYRQSMPYEDWMDEAKLVVHQELISCSAESQLFVSDMNRRIDLQPREPYKANPVIAYAAPVRELVKSRKIQAQAYLDFQSGRSVIVQAFRRNPEELRKIQETLESVRANPDVEVTGLFIEGYASPEGRYEVNERLARERAEALKNHIGNNFGVSKSIIGVSSVAEDWDGLRLLVEDSNLSNKDAILSIITGDLQLDVKEARIKRFPGDYRRMLDEMFPQLRRSDYRVDFTVKDFTVEESRTVLDRDPSMLSHYELYTLAKSYKIGSPEFNRIYEQIARLFPEDQIARINGAATMYYNGEYTGAKRRLEGIEGNAHAYNILGAILLIEGDLDKATELFNRAKSMGSRAADFNLQEVAKKREDNKKMERYRGR